MLKRIDWHIHPDHHSPGWLRVTDPSTGEEIADVGMTSDAQIESTLELATKRFQDRVQWLPLHQRVSILEKTHTLLEERLEAFSQQIAQEGGKPIRDARVETQRAILGIKRCIECISSQQGALVPMGRHAFSARRIAYTRREPIGVVLAISAFNHPLNLIVHQVATAVASGCPVLVKPANDTPLSCLAFVSLLQEAGLPDGWASVLIVPDNQRVEALVSDPRLAFVSFIGSARVGWHLRSQLAPGTRCALEHGGVAPAFVTASADLEKAATSLVKGAFYHAGQVCVSTQRIFLDHRIAHAFRDQFLTVTRALKTGPALAEDTDVGPLIRPTEVVRIQGWVDEAISAGAHRLCGGQSLGERFFEPTILDAPPASVSVSQQEIFGPVVCLYEYAQPDVAIAAANSLPYAFQAAIFSDSLQDTRYLFEHLAAAAVMINDHTAFREDGMPFAGLRQSGLGVGGIDHTIRDLQVDKLWVE